MGKKTMIPIKGKGYKIVHGDATGENASYSPVTLNFDSKIIAIIFKYYRGSDTDSHITHGYYLNPDSTFWDNSTYFDNTYPKSNPNFFIYNTAHSVSVIKNSDTSVTIRYNNSNLYVGYAFYTAILEEDSVVSEPIFLLTNTTLYTDGVVTSEVDGAIQTIEENKYKIKSNALVTITDATYANISN